MREIIGKRCLNSDALVSPGDFCWYSSGGEGVSRLVNGVYEPAPLKEFAGLGFMCPCGCGREGAIYTYLKGSPKEDSPGWEWDGDPEHPTLSPSIFRRKDEKWPENCGWHGHLVQGVWKPC